jgi:hypothetical protein
MNENVPLRFDNAELNYGLHFYTFLSNCILLKEI